MTPEACRAYDRMIAARSFYARQPPLSVEWHQARMRYFAEAGRLNFELRIRPKIQPKEQKQ